MEAEWRQNKKRRALVRGSFGLLKQQPSGTMLSVLPCLGTDSIAGRSYSCLGTILGAQHAVAYGIVRILDATAHRKMGCVLSTHPRLITEIRGAIAHPWSPSDPDALAPVYS